MQQLHLLHCWSSRQSITTYGTSPEDTLPEYTSKAINLYKILVVTCCFNTGFREFKNTEILNKNQIGKYNSGFWNKGFFSTLSNACMDKHNYIGKIRNLTDSLRVWHLGAYFRVLFPIYNLFYLQIIYFLAQEAI